ncbi:MAG: ATP-binding protein [Desulfobacterales bacterium]|jgi:signal transduction histidine kinase
MLNLSKIKPRFWDHQDAAAGSAGKPFSFRRKWKLIVLFTTVVTLTPLVVMTFMDYRLTHQAFESEAAGNTSRMVSNTWRSISFFLSQRRSALEFIARDNPQQALASPQRLNTILNHLKNSIGGFVDIGVLDAAGRIRAYAGPHPFAAPRPGHSPFFDQSVAKGFFVSDVASGPASHQGLIIAIRHDLNNGEFIILRAALDRSILQSLISPLAIDPGDDAFITNTEGLLQTASRRYGKPFQKIPLAVPASAEGTHILDTATPEGEPILVGYAHIPDSDLTLMIIRQKSSITDLWLKPRIRLIGFLIFSIFLIIASILGTATWLVNRIHMADQRRVQALHRVEYANKLASIGRLASGVAHEINNPLAIINQKIGLIKDLFTMQQNYATDQKLMGLVDDVLESILRCSSITRRLLDFSRHMESRIERVDIEAIIRQILGFMEKEVERRRIRVTLEIAPGIPEFMGDRGNLQQIFLNLVNNAFAAMADGGQLDITVAHPEEDQVRITVTDNGHGIPEEDIKRIFEPFFSTRDQHAGTGLGLSITYGLVTEMGGDIAVESQVGQGTRFTISVPLKRAHQIPITNDDDSQNDKLS